MKVASEVLVPGCQLDRYEMLMPVAEGGMASLWLAQQHGKYGFGRVVAIKTILPALSAEPGYREMFLDEARVASGLSHENVAQVLDLGDENGLLFIVMEWLEGDTLVNLNRAVVKSGALLPVPVLCRIIADACAGLHAVHELTDPDGYALNVIHRDVSPQNLFVEYRGNTKVIDFGVAKARDRRAHETTAGVVKGKIAYMAPEQAMGQSIDRRADVFGIGATMYRFLAGRAPFSASNQMASLRLIVAGEEPPRLRDEIPEAVRDVVHTAIELDPAKRFRTVDEMRLALEDALRVMGTPTTRRDVAAFMSQHLGPARASQTQRVEAALRASRTRMRASAYSGPGSSPLDSEGVHEVLAIANDAASTAPDGPRTGRRTRPPELATTDDEFYRRRTLPHGATLAGILGEKQAAPPQAEPASDVSDVTPTTRPVPMDGERSGARALTEPVPRRRSTAAWAVAAAAVVVLAGSAFHVVSEGRAGTSVAAPATVANATAVAAAVEVRPAAPADVPVAPVMAPVVAADTRASAAHPSPRPASAPPAARAPAPEKAADDCETLTARASGEEAQGAHASAVADYRRALGANPSYLPARVGLADALWASGDHDPARTAYRAILDQFPPNLCPDRVKQRAAREADPPSAPVALPAPVEPAAPAKVEAPAAAPTPEPPPQASPAPKAPELSQDGI